MTKRFTARRLVMCAVLFAAACTGPEALDRNDETSVRAGQRQIVEFRLSYDVSREHQLELATTPSTRFVVYWETDSNDVDLHVHDAKGEHAFYEKKQLASGGELYEDVTSGYGPEAFVIRGTPTGGPYKLSVDYYSQGPMGYGMGMLEIQTFDPATGFAFEQRPYVIMNAHAKVDLGAYR